MIEENRGKGAPQRRRLSDLIAREKNFWAHLLPPDVADLQAKWCVYQKIMLSVSHCCNVTRYSSSTGLPIASIRKLKTVAEDLKFLGCSPLEYWLAREKSDVEVLSGLRMPLYAANSDFSLRVEIRRAKRRQEENRHELNQHDLEESGKEEEPQWKKQWRETGRPVIISPARTPPPVFLNWSGVVDCVAMCNLLKDMLAGSRYRVAIEKSRFYYVCVSDPRRSGRTVLITPRSKGAGKWLIKIDGGWGKHRSYVSKRLDRYLSPITFYAENGPDWIWTREFGNIQCKIDSCGTNGWLIRITPTTP